MAQTQVPALNGTKYFQIKKAKPVPMFNEKQKELASVIQNNKVNSTKSINVTEWKKTHPDTPKTQTDKNYVVKRDRYNKLMQDSRLAGDIDLLEQIHYRNADQDATVSSDWADYMGAKAITGGFTKDEFVKTLSRRYGLTPKELNDMATTYHADKYKKESAEMGEGLKEFAKKENVLGSLASLLGTVGSGVEGLYNTVATGISGDDRYTSDIFRTLKNAPREGVKEDINSEIGKGAYGLGMGVADMLATNAVGSAPFLLAGNTANENLNSALQRGEDPRTAAAYSAATGTLDYITNRIGLNKARELAVSGIKGAGVGNFLARNGAAGSIEAAENALYTVGQQFIDQLVNGENAELRLSYEDKVANGMSPEDAISETAKEFWSQTGESALVGFGMGSAMQGNAAIRNYLDAADAEFLYNRQRALGALGAVDENMQPLLAGAMENPENLQTAAGKVETPEMPENTRISDVEGSEKLQTTMEKVGDVEDLIGDIEAEVNTRNYSDAELKELNDFVTKRDALLAEADKHVNMFNLAELTKMNDLIDQSKVLDSEIAEKYPELFENGKFRGLPEITEGNVKTPETLENIDNSGNLEYNANTEGEVSNGTDNIQSRVRENVTGNGQANTDIQTASGTDETAGMLGRGDNRVPSEPSVTPEMRQKMTDAGIPDYGLKRTDGATRFSQALEEGRKPENNSHGVFVSGKSPEEVQEILDNGGKVFLTDDNVAGLIVTADGDIEGVFNNAALAKQVGRTEKAFTDLMATAVANGGNKLDCYGPFLTQLYASVGFEPVAGSKYLKDKPWSAEMDSWKANEAARKGIDNVDDINTHVYVSKLRDGWTADDVVEAIKTGSLKEYADNLDLELDTVNKNLPDEYRNLPEDDEYEALLGYRDSLMGKPAEPSKITEPDVNTVETTPETTPTDVNSEPIELTQEANGELAERGTSEHIRSQQDVTVATPMKYKNLADEVADSFVNDPDMYNRLKNSDTQALADKIYESGDKAVSLNGKVYKGNAETKFRSLLDEKNPTALALGKRVADDYSAQGNHDMAAQIYRDMGAALTEAGQFTQASILNMCRNDPLTALAYFEKELGALNREGAQRYGRRWNDFELTDEERALFDGIKPGDTEAIRKAYNQIGARIEKEYPVSFLEKVLEFRRVAMLFNPRTVWRNFLANPPTAGMRYISDRIEGVGQNVAHLINPEFEVTQAARGSNRATRKGAVEVWNSDKVQHMFENTTGRLSEVPQVGDYARRKQIFKGGFVSNWINNLTNGGIEKLNARMGKQNAPSLLELGRNAAYGALEITDRPLVRENFVSRLGSYMRAKGITDANKVPDEAIQVAYEEALKATYKDNSWLVNAIKKGKGAVESVGNHIVPGGGDIASQALIPYVQAPGNIGARVVDYSAVGGTKGVVKIIRGATSGNQNLIRKGIEEASKGLSGTLVAGLGMALYKAGIITGSESEDPDQRAFDKQNGFREFAIRWKGTDGKVRYDTINWAQPSVDSLMQGVLLQQAIDESDKYDSDILRHFEIEGSTAGKLIGATKATAGKEINYFFNATPLQNFADLFKTKSNSYETDIADNIWKNTAQDFVTGLIPAGVNTAAKSIDPTQRQTTDPSNEFSSFLNSAKARVPWLSETLPVKYDTLGNPMTYGESRLESAFAKTLVPGEHTVEKSDKVTNAINEIFNDTGDKGVFPRVAPKSVDSEKLTAQEYSDYQKEMGEMNRDMIETFVNSDVYKDMDAQQKADIVSSMVGVSNAITARDIKGKAIGDMYGKAAEAYETGGAKALIEHYAGKKKEKAKEAQAADIKEATGMTGNSNVNKAIQADLDNGDKAAAEEKEKAAQIIAPSFTKEKSKATTMYYQAQKAIPELTPEKYVEDYKKMDTNGNEKVSQKELQAYINSLYGVGQEKEAQAYYDAFYDGWEKTKVVWDDKKKKYVVKK